MEHRYKLRLSSKQFYKEIELPPQAQSLTIGTGIESQERLKKELFFEHIGLFLQKSAQGWRLSCSDNLYLSTGGVQKRLSVELKHGDEFTIHYQTSDNLVCSLSFTLDFDYDRKAYDLELDISQTPHFQIGTPAQCAIRIQGEHLDQDVLDIRQENNQLHLSEQGVRYGVYHNGVQISGKAVIQEYDFFSIVGFFFYYQGGKLYTSSSPHLTVSSIPMASTQEHTTVLSYPKFNRNTRIQYQLPEEEVEVKRPANNPNPPRKNLLMTLIPALIMLAVTIILRGIIANGGTFVIYSVVSMGLGIIMSIVSFFDERKTHRRAVAKRETEYRQYIQEKTDRIQTLRNDELRVRELIYQSLEESVHQVEQFDRRLFERDRLDPDFLQVYLGKGSILSSNPVKYTQEDFVDTSDPLAPLAEEVAQSFRYLPDAPVTTDFHQGCGIGVVGAQPLLMQVMKNLTLDLSIRHFYSDVKLVYVLDSIDADRMNWVRWLRNVYNDQLDVRNIACDEESQTVLLEYLYVVLSARASEESPANDAPPILPQYVVFVRDISAIINHPLSKYLDTCSQYGFTFVFFQEHEECLPQGCAQILRLTTQGQGTLVPTVNGDQTTPFAYWTPPDALAAQAVKKLGAITVDEVALEGQLRKSITLFEMLGILSVSDLDLEARWQSSRVYQSMAAPLGVKRKDQLVYLDISDKAGAHGPHGLVAGTTGSGKSEILQAYILSMASLYHPYEVGFVIIDFKGGGMANQFKNLPHLIGSITNIDGREIKRSLLSIKAELVKRQEIFSAAEVNHINDYIKLYKAGKVTVPMAHLIMIVDEFAELKAEHPDFMKELISAARIGRTLGIHLILATQKPAGVVDAQIWSNSKFKLCLKVQTKEDSTEVLKTPLAAEIVEPGRAYFQVGNNEIFEFFQSAFSGADVPEGNEATDRPIALYQRNLWGKKTLVYTNKKAKSGQASETQLQAMVDYVQAYCTNKGIVSLPGICLPSLEDVIPVSQLNYQSLTPNLISVPVGIFDDPEQQRQGQISVELSRENVYIVGAAQMGKTVLLQTMAYGLISTYTPQQVSLYLIDCGSMVLKLFEEASHVGGVVLPNETEKCKNLFKLLNQEIVQRKNKLSASGVGNYAAYLEAEHTDMPLLVVMIDNMAGFKEYFPSQAEEIDSIARESQGVGISLIITAVSANALPYRSQANFGKKLVLNCNDPGEYSAVLGHCKEQPKVCVGRGLCVLDKRILEFQTAIFGQSPKEAQRSQELRDFITKRNGSCTVQAKPIPMVPEHLVLEQQMAMLPAAFKSRGVLPIGMDFTTVDFSYLNWNTSSSLSLVGDAGLRTAFLTSLLTALNRTIIFHEALVTLIDEPEGPLGVFSQAGFVLDYTTDSDQGTLLVDEYCDALSNRRADSASNHRILIVHNTQVLKKLCTDKTISKMVSDTLRNARSAGGFLLLSGIENQAISFSAPDLLKTIKDERQGIVFLPLPECKVFDIPMRTRPDNTFDSSMAYRFDGGNISKIKRFE